MRKIIMPTSALDADISRTLASKGQFTYDVSTLGGGGLVKCWQNLTWGRGIWPMMTSAKKDILLQLQQMHKQEYSTFEFEFEIDVF